MPSYQRPDGTQFTYGSPRSSRSQRYEDYDSYPLYDDPYTLYEWKEEEEHRSNGGCAIWLLYIIIPLACILLVLFATHPHGIPFIPWLIAHL